MRKLAHFEISEKFDYQTQNEQFSDDESVEDKRVTLLIF